MPDERSTQRNARVEFFAQFKTGAIRERHRFSNPEYLVADDWRGQGQCKYVSNRAIGAVAPKSVHSPVISDPFYV